MTKEVRTFSITYNGKMINIAVELEDTVTIEIGDWYFEGEVKKLSKKEDPTSILNYNSPSGSMNKVK